MVLKLLKSSHTPLILLKMVYTTPKIAEISVYPPKIAEVVQPSAPQGVFNSFPYLYFLSDNYVI